MARNKISDLRNHLFETLEMLKDQDDPMDIERAHAIAKVADSIIASAKIEVDFTKATGIPTTSTFIEQADHPVIELKEKQKTKAISWNKQENPDW